MKNPRIQAWLTRPDGLATMLRIARGQMSVRDLGKASGWGSSKVSKIETGHQIPTDADLKLWAKATKPTADERARWNVELDHVLAMRSTFRRRTEAGRPAAPVPRDELETVSAMVRCMQADSIPPLLQTMQYAHAYLARSGEVADSESALTELTRRQEYLSDPTRKFEFLLGESALRYFPGPQELMIEQLGHLLDVQNLRNVRLGIVPQMKPLDRMLPPASFVLYDDEDAVIATGVEYRQYVGSAVKALHETMDALWQEAIEGRGVRELIFSIKALIPIPGN